MFGLEISKCPSSRAGDAVTTSRPTYEDRASTRTMRDDFHNAAVIYLNLDIRIPARLQCHHNIEPL